MKSAVVVFPGINRERDMARTLKLVSGAAPNMVWHAEHDLPAGTDLVVVPGGFSYGDYLRCGAIAARSPIMDAVRAFAGKGGLVLGVCNGFQILCESGLLPGVLMRNENLRFICRDVYLKVERSNSPFTRGYNAGQVIRVPVAHGEGNYIADGETIARLEGEGRVMFRYSSPDGMIDPNWNHNGAINAIAGTPPSTKIRSAPAAFIALTVAGKQPPPGTGGVQPTTVPTPATFAGMMLICADPNIG